MKTWHVLLKQVGPYRRLLGLGSVRRLKGVAGGGTRKVGDLWTTGRHNLIRLAWVERRGLLFDVWQGRLSGKHYQLNQQITAADVGGGAARLFEIVRMRGGDGGPEALDFAHVNCSNWLNKYVVALIIT
jgi:hypothetical protein